MTILLATLAALFNTTAAETPPAPALESSASAVRLWLSNDRRFREGDRVRVQVDADVSGFLLVLNYTPEGRLQVLFPLDPRDDNRIEAGRRYEIRSESNTGAFRAGGDGSGFVYSAVSGEPWRLSEITLADRWDATRLEISSDSEDPEADITALVQRMAGSDGFDYDVVGYRVYGETIAYNTNTYVYPRGPTYIYDDYLFCNNWSWRYDGCHRYPYDGGWSISFGYGYGYPYYYDSFGRYRYNYGYGRPYYYPYHTTYPYFPRGPRANIVGRPRNYAAIPRGSFGGSIGNGSVLPRGSTFGGRGVPVSGAGPARGPRGNGAAPDLGGRPRGTARPSREGVGRGPNTRESVGRGPSNNASPPMYSAPARRSRGDGTADAPRRAEPRDRGAPPAARGEPSNREAPRARGGDQSRRDPPPARAEPRGRGSEPQTVRGNGGGNGGGNRAGGGGGGNGGGSRPSGGNGGGGRPRGRP